MKIEKANFTVRNNGLSISVPFAKVNQETRTISGFATLDNIDTANDVITFESSKNAFARSRARLREMHQPIAVGKIIDFKEDEFYDSTTQKFYRGIFVTAYVSKGAESTWEKVLDGTLTAFSVAGDINESHVQLMKNNDKEVTVRYITDWDLAELSLVDNPGNQLANILSIQKSDDGSRFAKGLIADVKTENIFWCEEDAIAKTSPEDALHCDNCSGDMKNIGWLEEGEDKVAKLREAVEKLSVRDGGVEMEKSEETVEKSAEEVAPVEENVEETSEVETATEETVEVEEAEANNEDVDLQKSIADLHELIKAGFSQNAVEVAKTIESVKSDVSAVVKGLEEQVTTLGTKYEELATKFEGFGETVEKRFDTVESATAVKKSADLGGSAETIVKRERDNFWDGSVLSGN
jgi:hypothetical protein